MKPAPFVYLRPTTFEQLLEMLQATAETAKLLAGGQSLIPLLNMRLARPGHLIDMNFLDGLSDVELVGDHLRIGAMVRQRDLELSEVAQRVAPLLVEALGHVAHVQVRHRGTVGGNIAHADPASELPAVMRALDATLLVRGPAGERRIPASEFFVSLFTTSMAETEVLVGMEVPVLRESAGWAFEEYARRRGDFALAAVAAEVVVDDGHLSEVRLCLAGVGATPRRCTEAEAELTGVAVDRVEGPYADAARSATEGLSPSPDLEAPPEYRIALTRELVKRALHRATARAVA